MEFVLSSFSCFNIEIAYSNFTFCGAWTPSFFAFRWKLSKFQENAQTPDNFDITGISSKCYLEGRNLHTKSTVCHSLFTNRHTFVYSFSNGGYEAFPVTSRVTNTGQLTMADPGFPLGESANSQGGANIRFWQISPKTWNWENLDPGGSGRPSRPP